MARRLLESVADADVRTEVLDPRRSFLVQAPAGSGKTELLIQRYLVLLARVDEPEAIVAITFTRKAAAEMRDRVLTAIERAQRLGPDTSGLDAHEAQTLELAYAVLTRDRERHWNLRQCPSRLRIQTIDSLCSAIASGMPSASGFGPLGEIIEEASHLYREAAHRTLLLLGSNDGKASDAIAALLLHLQNDVAQAEALIGSMLAKRDQWLRHLVAGEDLTAVRSRLDQTLREIVSAGLERLRNAIPAESEHQIVELAAIAARNRNGWNPADTRVCASLRCLPECTPECRALWEEIADLLVTSGGDLRKPTGVNKSTGFPANSPEKRRMEALLDAMDGNDEFLEAVKAVRRLPPHEYDDQQWSVVEALFTLLPRAAAALKNVFAERGVADFAELAQAALAALGSPDHPSDLALAVGHAIDHLLVDEYQDTSLTQQQLLERLTATWTGRDGRTLFLVGDPMQSIYRFRQAEVGVFLDAKKQGRLGSVPLDFRSITVNFRSQQGLVDWVNRAFPQVFPAADDIAESAVSYTPSEPWHGHQLVQAVCVHPYLWDPDDSQSFDQYADDEAQKVASIVGDVARRSPDATTAILVRARSHLAQIVPALKDTGLRFRAVEIDNLAERPAIIDLCSLTRALIHPADRIAWLSVLRAPWCGLTTGDLHTLCARDANSTVLDLLRTRASQLSEDGQLRVARALPVLEAAVAERRRQSLADAVKQLWIALGGPACVGSTDLENAEAFFDLLDELDTAAELRDIAALDLRLQNLFAAPDVEADDRLQVMTIHKAKGLQFDTVIVPGVGRRGRGDDPELLVWMERAGSSGAELLLAPISSKGGKPDALYSYVQREERERDEQEQRRLLYVAATRARTQLHLLGHAKIKEERGELGLSVQSGSLLEHLWPVVEADFNAELRKRATTVQLTLSMAAAAEEPAGLKRLPSDWTPPVPPPPLEWIAPAPPIPGPQEEITFDWVSDMQRHVGIVAHALLRKIALEGLASWTSERLRQHAPAIRNALANSGVVASELENAALRVEQVLANTLDDERGRWILTEHEHARSEFALSGVQEGVILNVILDRTFVADGVRWIVDFKTSAHEGGDREAFLENEQQRYRAQLECYARLISRLDHHPVRVALYYPLLRGWREWEPTVKNEPQ